MGTPSKARGGHLGDKDNPANPETGVFATRSADRPNPIGLHRVEILAVEGSRLRVSNMEAIDGTPILDLKRCCVIPRPETVTPPIPFLAEYKAGDMRGRLES